MKRTRNMTGQDKHLRNGGKVWVWLQDCNSWDNLYGRKFTRGVDLSLYKCAKRDDRWNMADVIARLRKTIVGPKGKLP